VVESASFALQLLHHSSSSSSGTMAEDIAVIGLGLRFPGDAIDPESLWKVLELGQSQWSDIPKERLNVDGYFHPSGDRQGSVSSNHIVHKSVLADKTADLF
jgi:hypothetical protein